MGSDRWTLKRREVDFPEDDDAEVDDADFADNSPDSEVGTDEVEETDSFLLPMSVMVIAIALFAVIQSVSNGRMNRGIKPRCRLFHSNDLMSALTKSKSPQMGT